MVEPELGRLRFLAPEASAGALLEQFYLEGGLVWCSQHDLALEDLAPLGSSAAGERLESGA
jgi:hypothetical protein